MNGAEILLTTAAAGGIEVCFANAGTTEMPLVVAFDAVPAVRPVLGLFEGVCTGAADGYGRMADKPAMTLLHLGPGFSNGLANLHNARRGRTPVFNVIGDHATWHLSADAPLTMDIAALAGTVSGWQRLNRAVEDLSQDTADAIAAARSGQVATLVVPNDHQWMPYPGEATAGASFSFDPVDADAIEKAVGLLRSARRPALLLDGRALRRRGLIAAARIRAATGCDLLAAMFPAYMERGAGLPAPARIPYFPEQAIAMLAPYDGLILAGAREPVAFFGYRDGQSGLLGGDTRRLRIDSERQDPSLVLEALADALGAPPEATALGAAAAPYRLPELPSGKLTAEKAGATLAALQPEGAIIVEEGLTSASPYFSFAATAAPHTCLVITGGAIGYGMPCATGAAVACPDRPVLNLQADGSAMYTLQALWTQAREGLNVTTLICANRSYFILQVELLRAGHTAVGPKALSLMDLGRPVIDWVGLGRAMGVPGVSVDTAEQLARELRKAFAEAGPHLIEMVF